MQSLAEVSKDRMEITLKTHVLVYDHVVDVAKMGYYKKNSLLEIDITIKQLYYQMCIIFGDKLSKKYVSLHREQIIGST